MSYGRSLEEARAAIKLVEPHNEANMAGSPILRGQADGGGLKAKGGAELAPKNYELVGSTKEVKRTL